MPKASVPPVPKGWRPAVFIVDRDLHRRLKKYAADAQEPMYKMVQRVLWATVAAWDATADK